MKLFLLDMRAEKYGDSIVITGDRKTILIDGGHPRDFTQRTSQTPSLPDQLRRVLGSEPPFAISLLVVTHCHADHIGCLPLLVEDGTIAVEEALMADPDLGYPPTGNGDARDAGDLDAAAVMAGLREEPRVFASTAEMDAFLADAVTLEQNYRGMLERLRRQSTRVHAYRGRTRALTQLERRFAPFGLQVLGPSAEHLQKCKDAIVQFASGARDAIDAVRASSPGLDALGLREIFFGRSRAVDATVPDSVLSFLDRPGRGAALNDQSIVLKLGQGPGSALLTGDMQLAAPEVADLDQSMGVLRRAIAEAGPYGFVKVPHHGSYNAFDVGVFRLFDRTPAFGITTGRGDPGHPHERVLALLREASDRITWARTDKNGAVDVQLDGIEPVLDPQRGQLDDYSLNSEDAAPRPTPEVPVAKSSRVVAHGTASQFVEITARIPHVSTRVTISIDVEPKEALVDKPVLKRSIAVQGPETSAGASVSDRGAIAGGRRLPRLLFVTATAALERNIGRSEARAALEMMRRAGQALLEIKQPADPFPEIRRAIGSAAGVVILGGYDVLPARRYDTLPAALRRKLTSNSDPDDFVVWSDQAYGDVDGDELGELPVSGSLTAGRPSWWQRPSRPHRRNRAPGGLACVTPRGRSQSSFSMSI